MAPTGFFRRIFFNDKPLTPAEYKHSRSLLIADTATAGMIGALSSGVFLAGLAASLGASDALNGMLASIPPLMNLTQIFSALLMERLRNRKLIIVATAALHRLLVGAIFFILLFVPSQTGRLVMLVAIYCMINILGSITGLAGTNWTVDLVPSEIRGRFFAKRDTISMAIQSVLSIGMGAILEAHRGTPNEKYVYAFFGAFIIASTIANTIILICMKEPPVESSGAHISLSSIVKIPLAYKPYRRVLVLNILWNIGACFAGPFTGVYMVTTLKLDYTYMMVLGLVGNLLRIVLTPFVGRLADRTNWALIGKLGMGLVGIHYLLWFATDINTWWLAFPLAVVVSSVGNAGLGLAQFNLQVSNMPDENRMMFFSLNSLICGVIGFCSTSLASAVLVLVGDASLKVGGYQVSALQCIFLFSGFLIMGCAFYISKAFNAPALVIGRKKRNLAARRSDPTPPESIKTETQQENTPD